ncbi:MAG TPA: hypothetical protein VG265_15470 [Gaiellaceae bacterium]|jgi:hypothetical protein|nr:hypothetical protein [Gaiellaceae bacterium]
MADSPRYDVRVVLCDLDGAPISLLTNISHLLSGPFRANRPQSLTFQVPSDDPMVNLAHTDTYVDPASGSVVQFPYLSEGNRTVKVYRRDAAAVAGTPGTGASPYGSTPPWTIFYIWRVWQLDDEGDEDTATTTVTCFDNWQVLNHRACLGSVASYGSTVYYIDRVDNVAKGLVDASNAFVGPTGITTSGGTFDAPTEVEVTYDEYFVGVALADLTNMGICDVILDPIDSIDGTHARLSIRGTAGNYKPNAVFAWDLGNRSIQKISRTTDMETVANLGHMFGGTSVPSVEADVVTNGFTLVSTWADTDSQARYTVLEDQPVQNQITNQALLDTLALEEAALRANPRELLTIVPNPDKAPIVKTEYWIHDTVPVFASRRLRKPIIGVSRVYGLDWGRDDDGFELVSQIITSEDAE